MKIFGFGRTCLENVIQDEIQCLLQEIKIQGKLVSFSGMFHLPLFNIWSTVMIGKRFEKDDEQIMQLLRNANKFLGNQTNSTRSGIQIPNFLLRIFPFLKILSSTYFPDLLVPIQDYMRVLIVLLCIIRMTLNLMI